ncbi:DUF6600 domain-containing protein [Pelomonas sp. SE-A7]|uniref:DUF6600 domain-containing protein n=1 Tax=Pelomonas sp. SE-A7 TaxID=3054953 RepID=UPI00259CA0F1|nr:DUF6600 domain-containing protein [Pelomonas sp. SE-A7]MDM4766073.1 hypothetical protein [Pelomonas sp. SE-A7]
MDAYKNSNPPLIRFLLLALTVLLLAFKPAWADPPGRVGRVAEVVGEAWLFDAEDKEWQKVERNQPITEGDRLRTDNGARISLRIGSTSIWLDERADLEFSRLDDEAVELLLARGQLALRLRSRENVAETRVITREGRFAFEREGLYRVDQLDRGSRGYAWLGQLRFEPKGEGASTWISGGEQAEFWWGNGPRVERQRIDRDYFGDWAVAQSDAEGDGPPARYVSAEMTGAEDLERHGRWEQHDEYGAIWFPLVLAVDWAPYRHGRWAWVNPWGWTWIDDARWGFAPFHYGRWVQVRGRWCWAPGRFVHRPVFAPALVAWVGGGNVSVGVQIGGGRHSPPPRFGWFPLAPREAYVPSYRHSPTYVTRVNVDIDVRGGGGGSPRYRNREVVGAVSVLPNEQPWRGRPQPFKPDGGAALTVVQAPVRGDGGPGRGNRVEVPQWVNQPGNRESRRNERDADRDGWRDRGNRQGQPTPAVTMPQVQPGQPVQSVQPVQTQPTTPRDDPPRWNGGERGNRPQEPGNDDQRRGWRRGGADDRRDVPTPQVNPVPTPQVQPQPQVQQPQVQPVPTVTPPPFGGWRRDDRREERREEQRRDERREDRRDDRRDGGQRPAMPEVKPMAPVPMPQVQPMPRPQPEATPQPRKREDEGRNPPRGKPGQGDKTER